MRIKNQTGFTLVELLVALALGVLLLGIVVTIYLGSKATSRAATGVARSQEATRFATHFIKQDLRMSGFVECAEGLSNRILLDDSGETYPPSLEYGLFGWEFTGTDVGDSYTLDYAKLGNRFTQADLDAARLGNAGSADEWTGEYIQGIPGTSTTLELPAQIAGLSPLQGSDILMLSISTPLQISDADPSPVLVQKRLNQRIPTLNVIDGDGVPVPSGVETGSVLKVGDCTALDTFQNVAGATDTFISADGADVLPGNDITGAFKWQKKWDTSARIYETVTSVYYVGTGSSGKPSLFRFATTCGIDTAAPAACGAASQELVEGVESMQVLYGEDTDTNPDGAANIYRSADQVIDFRYVVSVKVGLLVRSPDAGTDNTSFPTLDLLDEITIDPPDDQFQRFVNNTTIRLHNRGL